MNQSTMLDNGWGKGGKPKVTPEPAVTGLVIVLLCLIIFARKRYLK